MAEKELKKVGARLQAQRKSMRLELTEVAEQIPVHPRTLTKWENGHADPPSGKLVKLAKILQTTVSNILEETPPPVQHQSNNNTNTLEGESYVIHNQVISFDRETMNDMQQHIKFLEQIITQEREEKKVLWDIVMGSKK